jgi:hypothetical protein
LGSNAKISELYFSRLREQDIGGFDVAMELVLAVQVFEAEEDLVADGGDMRFGEGAGFELVRRRCRIRRMW